ncbi:hypothetical protein BGW39_001955 [Mortierella sp. 14UC]|nr:hypothetical protein BGW39_001955 [Mortierella sp. 14UC]
MSLAEHVHTYDESSVADTVYDSDSYDDFDDYVPEDNYVEYDDIHLSPPLLHKPRPKRNRNKELLTPKKSNKHPGQIKVIQPLLDTSTTPELPPEILERICTHLSQSTLLYSVNLVCKKWREVSNRFVSRVGIWKSFEDSQELLLQQWPIFNTLELWFDQEPEKPYIYTYNAKDFDSWSKFAAAITKPIPTTQEAQHDSIDTTTIANIDNGGNSTSVSAESLCLLHSIRHMDMRGLNLPYKDVGSKLRGHLQFIESLTITTTYYYAITPLFTILADFPSLKQFTLSITNRSLTAQLAHGDDNDNIEDLLAPKTRPDTAGVPYQPWTIPPPKMFPDRYRLQEFTIDGVLIRLNVLERLIVTCPDLRVFKADKLMFIRKQVGNEEHRAQQRLIYLVAKHCPKLEWYLFRNVDYQRWEEEYHKYVTRSLPDHKILSIALRPYRDSMFTSLAIRSLLSRITFLEFEPPIYLRYSQSALANRILCLTPSLLHLVAPKLYLECDHLWEPTPLAAVEPVLKPVFATIRDRKRYERNERRQARQRALAKYQPQITAPSSTSIPVTASDDVEADGGDGDNTGEDVEDETESEEDEEEDEQEEEEEKVADTSTPVTWQLYNLKTLTITFFSRRDRVNFAQYICRHRLFRNLVSLNLEIRELRVGQRDTIIEPNKSRKAAVIVASHVVAALNVSGSCGRQNSLAASVPAPPGPSRFSNELLAFRGMQCLEECVLRTKIVPGMLLAKDFAFLRRKEDCQTTFFLRSDNNDAELDDENGDDEEQLKNETFWPKLCTFHVYYIDISPYVNTSKLVSGIERILPGVSVRFKAREAVP